MNSTTNELPAQPSTPRGSRARCLQSLAAVAVGASLLCGAGTALAQDPGPAPERRYVVLTHDGSRFEGELVERVTGDHVTVRLVTGDVRTIPAANVKAEWRPGLGPVGQPINGGPPGYPAGLMQNPASPAVTGVPLAYQGPDQLTIHLANSDNESGTLYHESPSGWEVVCQMPCTTTVDPKGSYKIHNSDVFHFPSGPGSVDLVADIGSRRRNRMLATWLIGLGIAATPMGGLLIAGVVDHHLTGGPTTADKAAGGTVLGVGVAMIIAGITLAAVGPTSTLTTTSGQRIAQEPSLRLTGGLSLTPRGLTF